MTNPFTSVSNTTAARLAATGEAVRRMLARQTAADAGKTGADRRPPTIDGVTGDRVPGRSAHEPEAVAPGPDWLQYVPADLRGLVASHLPAGLWDGLGETGLGSALPPGAARTELPKGAQFLSRAFSNQAGTRPYRLFVPSCYTGQPVPLVVMLHGCTQSPEDFAAGTGMNDAAEEQVFLVVYPGQPQSAHPQKCWKWFSAADQQRGSGEPSLIAGITRQVMAEYAVDPRRVYVAGLSAGGAAAAIMGEAYPDLYAAVGVHSGLPCGAARDLPSALAAMKGGGSGHRPAMPGAHHRTVPTIVFHGDRDTTVSPRNADAVVAQSAPDANGRTQTTTGQTPGGHGFRRTIRTDETGNAVTEQWTIHGAGHAWSGGRAPGSYTDPRGPDATREMLRFFREHPHPAPVA